MKAIVSITSQGQVSIPKKVREMFNISGPSKAVLELKDQSIIITPQQDFWSLEGKLSSDIKLSDEELREARNSFSKDWAKQ